MAIIVIIIIPNIPSNPTANKGSTLYCTRIFSSKTYWEALNICADIINIIPTNVLSPVALKCDVPTTVIPKNIISNVLEQYKIIRELSKIHRGEILKGIIGSLIYYECLKEGIVRKPKELANWYSISEKDLSKGDKILRELEENNIIKLQININNNDIYIASYLKRIGIDDKYQHFLNDLLERLEEKKIGNPNARLSTKVSAILFLLIISKEMSITTEELSKEFEISVSTFKVYYLEIIKNSNLINDILEKYNIILPKKIPRKVRQNKKTKDVVNED